MKNPTSAAHEAGHCCLLHDLFSLALTNGAERHKVKQIYTWRRSFQDHDVVILLVLPVQQLNDLWNLAASMSQYQQADLKWKRLSMTSLEERLVRRCCFAKYIVVSAFTCFKPTYNVDVLHVV